MSDLSKVFAENQKELLKLIALSSKKSVNYQNVDDFDSETGKVTYNCINSYKT